MKYDFIVYFANMIHIEIVGKNNYDLVYCKFTFISDLLLKMLSSIEVLA